MQEPVQIVTGENLQLITAVASASATVVISVLSYLVWRSNKRIEWLTGALESHSDIQLAIAAKEAGMEVIWWDPTLEKVPTVRKHGEPRDLSRVYTFLPLGERAGSRKR